MASQYHWINIPWPDKELAGISWYRREYQLVKHNVGEMANEEWKD